MVGGIVSKGGGVDVARSVEGLTIAEPDRKDCMWGLREFNPRGSLRQEQVLQSSIRLLQRAGDARRSAGRRAGWSNLGRSGEPAVEPSRPPLCTRVGSLSSAPWGDRVRSRRSRLRPLSNGLGTRPTQGIAGPRQPLVSVTTRLSSCEIRFVQSTNREAGTAARDPPKSRISSPTFVEQDSSDQSAFPPALSEVRDEFAGSIHCGLKPDPCTHSDWPSRAMRTA